METKELLKQLLKTSTSIKEGELLKALLSFYNSNEDYKKTASKSVADIDAKIKIRDNKISLLNERVESIEGSIDKDIASYSTDVDNPLTLTVSHKTNIVNIATTEDGTEYEVDITIPEGSFGDTFELYLIKSGTGTYSAKVYIIYDGVKVLLSIANTHISLFKTNDCWIESNSQIIVR